MENRYSNMAVHAPMDIIIAGGSLAGLYSGIVLSRLGHNVTILERYPARLMKDQGAGLSAAIFRPSIVQHTIKLGISKDPVIELLSKYDRTKTRYFREDVRGLEWQFLKRDGSVKSMTYYPDTVPASTSWDILYNILRANFDGGYEEGYVDAPARESGDGKTEYIYETRVTSIREDGDLVEVQFIRVDGKIETRKCNLVIGADGAGSTVRRLFLPECERTYTGYATWRGTISADRVTSKTRESLGTGLTQFFSKGNQVVYYPIPGHKGTLIPDKQQLNIVWYQTYAPNSAELKEFLTDTSGITHQFSLPADSVQPKLVRRQQALAGKVLPPQLSEVFQNLEKPFVTVITDSLSPKSVFLNEKVLLVGDALAGLRPHTGAGSSQAAMHALLLYRVFKEKPDMTLGEWEEKVCAWGKEVQELGVQLGTLSQFGNHPMADDESSSSSL